MGAGAGARRGGPRRPPKVTTGRGGRGASGGPAGTFRPPAPRGGPAAHGQRRGTRGGGSSAGPAARRGSPTPLAPAPRRARRCLSPCPSAILHVRQPTRGHENQRLPSTCPSRGGVGNFEAAGGCAATRSLRPSPLCSRPCLFLGEKCSPIAAGVRAVLV